MKEYIVLVALFFAFTNCKAQRYTKDQWIDSFKDVSLYGSLSEITDNNFRNYLWSKKDISLTTQSELLGRYKALADSTGRNFAKKIKPIQVDTLSDMYGMKRYFDDCIAFYKGKYLDSLAKKYYKNFKSKSIIKN